MAAKTTARRLEACRDDLDRAVKDTVRALPESDLDRLQAIFDQVTEPRRKLAREQQEFWEQFVAAYRARYAEVVAQRREDDKIIIWP
jgi:hypothetical protein